MANADRLIEIFDVAKARPAGAERDRFLAEIGQNEPELMEQVVSLLQSDEGAGDFLKHTLLSPPATITEKPGDAIGRYKLLEKIGEGGCGVVYVAEQIEPVRRRVALKVIKPGMDTKEVIVRFEQERQALALMDHPNIAKVLDAGVTPLGRPFFVMELVRGTRITEFCDQGNLSTALRLDLFVAVCNAIQHAHQKGIIHRDIKPSNILVTLHDSVPVPKVIDFGMAKAIQSQRLSDLTVFTQVEQMIGTPLYMSPEQAGMSGLDIDTRSDIYSLGVLLYELLTGTTPFDSKTLMALGIEAMRKTIREEEPLRPSTQLTKKLAADDVRRLKSLAAGETTSEEEARASSRRLPQIQELVHELKDDLDWIVMKALEKDRARRYQSVYGLAQDIQRYLNDEAVEACPPSAGYRLRKLFRRHKRPVLAGLLVLLALVAGVIGTTWGLVRATAARADALKQAAQKEEALKGKQLALTAAQQSERDKALQLWEALFAQASANRLSRRSGQRFATLVTLQSATQLARTLNLPAEKIHQLRNAAIATLALPDLYLAGPWNPWPNDGGYVDFDEAHAIYARADKQGNCSVRRVTDDVEIHCLPGLGGVAVPILSRNGKFIAILHTDSEGKTNLAVHLWQIDGLTPHRVLAEEQAHSPTFRDSEQLAMAYRDGSIRVFELPGGRQISRLAPDTLTRNIGIALHPTEAVVAVHSYYGSVVQIRDLETGKVQAAIPQTVGAISVAWHPNGSTLAVGYGESTAALLYDRTTLEVRRTFEVGDFGASVSFNHTGDRLLTRGWGAVLALFDVGTGQKLWTEARYSGHRFSADDHRLAGAVQDGKLGIWQLADGREYRTLLFKGLPDRGEYFPGAVSSDGQLLAAAVSDGIGVWNLVSGSEVARLAIEGRLTRVLFEPSGSLLILSQDGLSRWPVSKEPDAARSLKLGPPESLPLPYGSALGQSRDGRVIVGCDRTVGSQETNAGGWILHTDRTNQLARLDPGADIFYVAVSPDGRWIVTVTHNQGIMKIWEARSGRLIKQLESDGFGSFSAGASCFSPDGRWLRTGWDGGRLITVGTWEPGPQVGSGASVFAPDNRLMAIATTTGIRLFDSTTKREIAMLEDPNLGLPAQILFTPDGTKLLSVTTARGIHVWDLRLLRRRLKELGLDWDWPEFPQAGKSVQTRRLPENASEE